MTDTSKKWAAALVYVAAIYSTLGVAPRPLAVLRAHNCLRLTLAVIFTLCTLGVLNIIRFRTRKLVRYLFLLPLLGAYVALTRFVQTPEEQVHFLQYGLVGILFLRAVRRHVPSTVGAYAAALTIASIVGWGDEILQGHVAGRHYDVRDIQLNIISSLLGLMVFLIAAETGRPTEDPGATR